LHGVKTGTLPRNRLAASATGGASAYFLSLLTKSMPPETKKATGKSHPPEKTSLHSDLLPKNLI